MSRESCKNRRILETGTASGNSRRIWDGDYGGMIEGIKAQDGDKPRLGMGALM